MKVKLEIGVLYEFNINNISFGPLSSDILLKLFSDGRIGGRMVEPIIPYIFEDFSAKITGNNKFDLVRISDNSKQQEVKTFTKSSGCKLIPSGQIGSKRKYCQKDYLDRVKKMENYIIVDIREFPRCRLIARSSQYIKNNYPDGNKKVPDTIFTTNRIINIGSI